MPDTPKKLEKKLGVTFADKDLLTQAVVHRSYLNENRDFALPHNERLEFLGDAVLELVVTDHLYRTYENPEGDLTSWRSAVVRGEKLAVLADRLGVGGALLMSRGEEKSGGRTRPMLLANAFEAIVGAMYLDQGYDVTKEFIDRTVIAELPKIIKQNLDRDAKSKLQEVAQEAVGLTPKYRVREESGPDHDKRFTVAVLVGDNELGIGSGSSKQQAEQRAAEQAFKGDPKAKLRQTKKT